MLPLHICLLLAMVYSWSIKNRIVEQRTLSIFLLMLAHCESWKEEEAEGKVSVSAIRKVCCTVTNVVVVFAGDVCTGQKEIVIVVMFYCCVYFYVWGNLYACFPISCVIDFPFHLLFFFFPV
jgi:hypothetical protein